MNETYNKLAKIQKELRAPKGQFNAFGKYNYRSCEDILEAVKPLLDGAILRISDEIILIGDRHYVKATVTFAISDEQSIVVTAYAREEHDKKGMDASQITGAASSYARKYALNGLFLIDDTKDADTMDNATKQQKTSETQSAPTESKQASSSKDISLAQMKTEIYRMLFEINGSADAVEHELKRLTTWTNKEGKVVEGKTNVGSLNEKPNAKGQSQTSVTYLQVRDVYEKRTKPADDFVPETEVI